MSYVNVDKGIGIYVEDWGQGKPIVFIHGWPFDHRIFEYQMMKLAQANYRAIGIDLRGYGLSDKPWDGNDYDTWSADIGKVIESLNLNEVMLVGFSMGGAIAAHYVATHNDTRVNKLVLVSAAVPVGAADAKAKQTYTQYISSLQNDQAKFTHEFIRGAFGTSVSPEYLRWLENMGTLASLPALTRGLEEMRDRDLATETASIRLPTSIYHGTKDRVIPFMITQTQQQLLKNSTLMKYETSGHAIFWDEKDKFADEMDRFARLAIPAGTA